MSTKAKSGSRSGTKAARQAQRVAARTPPPGWKDPLAQQQPLVSARWLFRAVLAVVGVAVICAYLTLCLLFYQGQWQVVFHPSRTVTATPESVGLHYNDIRFDYTQTGAPQLDGWWIPANAPDITSSRLSRYTVLYLHDGHGSLSDTLPQVQALHTLGMNIFAFDYRGFGNSASVHPSEQRVYEDADAAWTYLTDIRHLDPRSIVLYGTGLGAAIAAEAAIRHPQSIALVLENPAPPALSLIQADSRTHLLPIKWLFRDRFEILPKLQKLGFELGEPVKAVVASGKTPLSPEFIRAESSAGDVPKLLIVLGPNPESDPHYSAALMDLLPTR